MEEIIINSTINQTADYTAEVIVSSIIKKGVSPEQIILKSKGTSKRSHKKDVSTIYTISNEETNSNLFFLESPREGIYDTLPESIFHSFSGSTSVRNKEEIKEEIKKHREEEKQARLFFLPFEQEFFTIKRTLFEFEDAFDWLSNAPGLIEMYKSYYPVLSDLSIEKGYLFLRLTPLIHELRDDFPKIESCLTMLLDTDVHISLSFQQNVIHAYTPAELGFARLGINTIIGDVVEDGEPDLCIVLTPTIHPSLQDYSFFNHTTQLTKQLCDYFIGAQYNISILYAHTENDAALSLNDTAVLGYNVCL